MQLCWENQKKTPWLSCYIAHPIARLLNAYCTSDSSRDARQRSVIPACKDAFTPAVRFYSFCFNCLRSSFDNDDQRYDQDGPDEHKGSCAGAPWTYQALLWLGSSTSHQVSIKCLHQVIIIPENCFLPVVSIVKLLSATN